MAMTNIKVADVQVHHDHYDRTGDPTLYDGEGAMVVYRLANEGEHTGQFKVQVNLDWKHVHEEWVHDLGANSEKVLHFHVKQLHAGEHVLEIVADATDRVAETQEYWDNIARIHFQVGTRVQHLEDEVVEVHISEKQWEKAGWKRGNVYVQIWDYDNNPLTGYDIHLNVQGQDKWHAPTTPLKNGAAEFNHLLLHPGGTLHLVCQTHEKGLLPKLEGQFHANLSANNIVQIDAWQDTAIETYSAADAHSLANQLSVAGKVSFKILGDRGGVEVGGGYQRTTTDMHTDMKVWRVLVPKKALLPQAPARSF
jgi:CARDB